MMLSAQVRGSKFLTKEANRRCCSPIFFFGGGRDLHSVVLSLSLSFTLCLFGGRGVCVCVNVLRRKKKCWKKKKWAKFWLSRHTRAGTPRHPPNPAHLFRAHSCNFVKKSFWRCWVRIFVFKTSSWLLEPKMADEIFYLGAHIVSWYG